MYQCYKFLINIDKCWQMWANILEILKNLDQWTKSLKMLTNINKCYQMLTNINIYQQMLTNINKCYQMVTKVNKFQQILIWTNLDIYKCW